MNIVDILELKYPGKVGWDKEIQLVDHNDGNGIQIDTWGITDPVPTIDQLNIWAIEFDLAYRQKEAVAKRRYPDIGDQLDMIYHDKLNNTTIWIDTITAIKVANPKPTE